ncbi:MAG: pantetheine-phosphate adenylyltransferase [Candidatus Omnitrophota bacterium]|nr:pantetheine-phosphate adenylyltransferase [Candidatus Omnitrophota bacterium]
MEKRRAIYPGSFDPVTLGHLDLIKRALLIFDEIIVAVAVNTEKKTLFSLEERTKFVKKAVHGLSGVRVESMVGLTVDYAKSKKAHSIVRGLRATSDFEYEFQMALTNRKLSKRVDTVFLMPSESFFYLSSRLIKEIAAFRGDISDYVPRFVVKEIRQRLREINHADFQMV